MAQNDVGLFDQHIEGLGDGVHNLDSNVIRAALIDAVQTPVATSADPRWGAGGTVNFDTNEVTQGGGNYALEGLDITATWSQAAGVGTFDAADISTWTIHASNPDDARWIILYDDGAAGKQCIGWVDLGAVYDMTTGDLNVTWNGSGIYTASNA